MKVNADGTLPMLRDADGRTYLDPAVAETLATGATPTEGQKGPTGDQGPTGDKGPTGDPGPTGGAGPTGDQGPVGDKGPSGDQGAVGTKGATGDKGPVGDKGPTGDAGPQGQAGASGSAYVPTFATLANGATEMALGTNDAVKVTPTANATYTTTVPVAGTRRTVLVLTSGTSSRTITFGTGFKPVGTLATGTTSARVFAISFISDGTNLYETGRTAAMVA